MNKSIIKYITGDLSEKQSAVFEEIIKTSPDLLEIRNKYEGIIRQVKETTEIPLNQGYFASIIPNFRARLEKSDRREKTLKWSISFSAIASVIILAILLIQPRSTNDLQDVISELDHNEVKAMVEDMQIDITPAETEEVQKINDLYIEELTGKDQIIISSDLVTSSDILSTLSDEDAKLIYEEMINKDILKD